MKCLVYAITALLFLSCTPDNIKREYEQLKSNRIIMPDYEYAMIKGRDTLVSDCFHEKLKLIVFTDSTSCNSCSIENIYDWSALIDHAEQYDNQLCFYFIFTPKKIDIEDVKFSLTHTDFDYPLILDTLGMFRNMNPHIPENKLFHTILLDENNQVIMIGSPLYNSKVRELFEDIVKENLDKA